MNYIAFYRLWCTQRQEAWDLLLTLDGPTVVECLGIKNHPLAEMTTGGHKRRVLYFAGSSIFHQTAKDGDFVSFNRLLELVDHHNISKEDIARVLRSPESTGMTPLILAMLYDNLDIALTLAQLPEPSVFHRSTTFACLLSHRPCPDSCPSNLINTVTVPILNPMDYLLCCAHRTRDPSSETPELSKSPDKFLQLTELVAQTREGTPYSLSIVIGNIVRQKMDVRLIERLIRGYANRYGTGKAWGAFSAHVTTFFRAVINFEGMKLNEIQSVPVYFRELTRSIAAAYGGKIAVSNPDLVQILELVFTTDLKFSRWYTIHSPNSLSETFFFDTVLEYFDLTRNGAMKNVLESFVFDVMCQSKSSGRCIAPHLRNLLKAEFQASVNDVVVCARSMSAGHPRYYTHDNFHVRGIILSTYNDRVTQIIADRQEVIEMLMMTGYPALCYQYHPGFGGNEKRCTIPEIEHYPEIKETIDTFHSRLTLFSLLSFFFL